MRDFETNASAAEVSEIVAELRIYEGDGVGEFLLRLVVVEDNRVDSGTTELGDFVDGGGTAIHSDEQLRTVQFDAAADTFGGQSVAFIDAVGEEGGDVRAIRVEHAAEHGEGGHAIHIVVAEKHDALAIFDCDEEAIDCGVHRREQEWIAKGAQLGIEKDLGVCGVGEAAADEEFGHPRCEARRIHQTTGHQWVNRIREQPAHCRGLYRDGKDNAMGAFPRWR
jgi:hypothetical protein